MRATTMARTAIDACLHRDALDAVVALTTGPGWRVVDGSGDPGSFYTSAQSAAAGYPVISVPAGLADGMPVGLSFMGPMWSEARLLEFAYAFESERGPFELSAKALQALE